MSQETWRFEDARQDADNDDCHLGNGAVYESNGSFTQQQHVLFSRFAVYGIAEAVWQFPHHSQSRGTWKRIKVDWKGRIYKVS